MPNPLYRTPNFRVDAVMMVCKGSRYKTHKVTSLLSQRIIGKYPTFEWAKAVANKMEDMIK